MIIMWHMWRINNKYGSINSFQFYKHGANNYTNRPCYKSMLTLKKLVS